MACVEPSDRVIVPSLPVTPAAAVAGPFTGGQYVAHDPLQFDLVAVSGANQYSVNPFALVSTVAPAIFVVFRAELDEPVAGVEAALDEEPPEAAGLDADEPDDPDELPHAAAIRAIPARPAGAHHRLRMSYPARRRSICLFQHVTRGGSVHDQNALDGPGMAMTAGRAAATHPSGRRAGQLRRWTKDNRETGMANDEFIQALNASREIELTVTGRKSGREISIPVWFVPDGQKLYLVPVRGSDSDWYKNVLKKPTIRLTAGGAQLTARATPITDAAKVGEILGKFRERYGAEDVAAYYPRQDAAVQIR